MVLGMIGQGLSSCAVIVIWYYYLDYNDANQLVCSAIASVYLDDCRYCIRKVQVYVEGYKVVFLSSESIPHLIS